MLDKDRTNTGSSDRSRSRSPKEITAGLHPVVAFTGTRKMEVAGPYDWSHALKLVMIWYSWVEMELLLNYIFLLVYGDMMFFGMNKVIDTGILSKVGASTAQYSGQRSNAKFYGIKSLRCEESFNILKTTGRLNQHRTGVTLGSMMFRIYPSMSYQSASTPRHEPQSIRSRGR